jgi:hypothetical protein
MRLRTVCQSIVIKFAVVGVTSGWCVLPIKLRYASHRLPLIHARYISLAAIVGSSGQKNYEY